MLAFDIHPVMACLGLLHCCGRSQQGGWSETKMHVDTAFCTVAGCVQQQALHCCALRPAAVLSMVPWSMHVQACCSSPAVAAAAADVDPAATGGRAAAAAAADVLLGPAAACCSWASLRRSWVISMTSESPSYMSLSSAFSGSISSSCSTCGFQERHELGRIRTHAWDHRKGIHELYQGPGAAASACSSGPCTRTCCCCSW